MSLMLAANLIATGVPVIHAWAHEAAHGHAPALSAAAGVDHPHEEIHGSALHDDDLLLHRAAPVFALAAPTSCADIARRVVEGASIRHPAPPATSRALPGSDRPRAPPLA
ncbi:MAG: hypothetical protein RRA92_09920 [Gemmatimonadota bacterium]|nr:hypothetical protein [Gemmatimonadota bacterium]